MKKLTTILTVIGVLVASFTGKAQSVTNGKVIGTVTALQKPAESASIGLLRTKDSALVKLAVTDHLGQFEFDNIKEGSYLVSVQLAGYNKFYSAAFAISNEQKAFTVKNIHLAENSKMLVAVTVIAQKPMIEQKIDRTVLNVEASVTNTGSNALDVLEKSPGVSVDKDGNISLKGKQGVQVFIDGRPTYLSGADLANMLRNMQSTQLDQVEIMTNPPAKYDAAGNSGIINIKTKKNKQVGYNGSVTAGYGQGVYPKINGSANMNYRNGKINLFGNLSYAYRERFQTLSIQRKFIDMVSKDIKSNFDQVNNLRNNDEPLSGKFGFDYFASKKTTLGLVINSSKSNQEFTSESAINIADPGMIVLNQTRAMAINKDVWKNFSTNANLRHQIDTAGSELTADLDYIKYTSGNIQSLTNAYFTPNGTPLPGYRSDTLYGKLPQDIAIYSAKIDYVKPLKKGAKFEAGFKWSSVSTNNNAVYDSLLNNRLVPDYGRTNQFIYKENINAAYVNYSRPINKKLSGQVGLRVEQTHSNGNQVTTADHFIRDYVQFFPTLYIQYQANTKNTYVLNYGKRIGRPDYESMNPFVHFLDKYTYQQGNPNLQPQFSHNIELTHTYNGFLTTTLNYTKTTDIIQQVLEQNTAKNESYIRQANIANQRQYGISVNAAFPVNKWWTSNIYVNAYNNEFSGIINGDQVTISATTGMFNIMEQFKFNKGWGAELSGFGRTEGVDGVFRIKGFGMMNMGVSKQMMKNKASLKLSIRDLLWSQKIKGESKYSNVDASFRQYGDSRVVNISFTYRFSKGKPGNIQRKRGGASEEASRIKTGDSQ
ncbi:MAG: TonB dependent receptor [Sediminibacterium sp.]|nr:TonB dependent receptor [Sediminibacterium sp.]MDP3129245.1 TonB dependent receptor [Sediminibacterium sp.]